MDYLNERQNLILSYLHEHKQVTVRHLQAELNIPTATLYRDIRVLVDSGYADRARGRLTLAHTDRGRPQTVYEEIPGRLCVQCAKPVNFRTVFPIRLAEGTQIHACCPHCGLLYLQENPDVVSAMTADFLYGTMVNVRKAYYVVASRVRVCCSPAVISFVDRLDARNFEAGFGGQTLNYEQALIEVVRQMALHQEVRKQDGAGLEANPRL